MPGQQATRLRGLVEGIGGDCRILPMVHRSLSPNPTPMLHHHARHLVASVALAGIAGCTSSQSARNDALVSADDATRFAYGVGYSVGEDVREGLAADGVSADSALLCRGFSDAIQQKSPAMPKRELDRVLRAVHRAMLDNASQRRFDEDPQFRQLANANAAISAKAIDAFAAQPGATTVEEGVVQIVLATGSGPKTNADEAFVADWSMAIAGGTQVIDTRTGAIIDPDKILPVAARVLSTMRVGDHRRIAFAANKAFGLGGDAPAIGPNEALFIDITITGTATRQGTP